jgi:predicted NUDIX family NTP pyrophosphohydrolase
MKRLSAGVLLYRIADGRLQVLLVHPGGPFWAKKDLGAWSIPKGEYDQGQDAREAALRELGEETGLVLEIADLTPLRTVTQGSGKVVTAWAAEHDFDVATLVSNTFEMEWPKGTGAREFPEVDRAEWFSPPAARRKVLAAQAEFIDRLVAKLREDGREFDDDGPSAQISRDSQNSKNSPDSATS